MSVFYVSGSGPLSAGRDHGCDLVLFDSFVSRCHLSFRAVTCDVAVVEVYGTNGAVIGGTKVNKGYRGYVRAGSSVLIGPNRIVWTGDHDHMMRQDIADAVMTHTKVCEHTTVEIEGPPQRKVPEKPSVALAAGPALTMAVPILLGASRSVAVLSSVFAACWAVANVLSRVRKLKSEERRRKNTYLSYLAEREECIRSALGDIRRSLFETYPDAGKFIHTPDAGLMWERGEETGDVLTVRSGRGVIASPLEIVIPKDRFAGIDDSLKDMPRILKEKYDRLPDCPVLIRISRGSSYTVSVRDEMSRRMLSALIIQLASTYPPERLSIATDLNGPVRRYYMWIVYLPHFRAEDKDESDARTIVITDKRPSSARPAAGQSVIYVSDDAGERVIKAAALFDTKEETRFDTVSRELAFSYAASLARIHATYPRRSGIPGTVPFGALFDGATDANGILAAYESCDVTADVSAPIGIGERGRIMLDIFEKGAGPHGLIAGTTGSGKSELLTSMILAFAMRYPPDRLAFFLIDYKGGGMSNLFGDLPHLIGNISNLSKAESQRAMIALNSENIRRQKIFAKHCVNNISDYTKLYDKGLVDEPLPHIVIVVDEFAELKKQESDLMDRLISVAQVGRSLGMHLILATQKPAGVVDDRIRANSRFKIALRLAERSDSVDMLGKADAASIRECGRAYLQVGNDEIYECFQSGYAMAPARETDTCRIYEDPLLERELKFGDEGRDPPGEVETYLDAAMSAIKEANAARPVPMPRKLWLPMLPNEVTDTEAFAILDDPYNQRYVRAVYEPERYGHVWISGKSGSGKSELVLTMLVALSGRAGVYIIDHGGGVLKRLADKKWCGGYIGDDDPEDVARMIGFVCEMASYRRKIGDHGENEPVILAIDNYTDAVKTAGCEAADHLIRILTLGKSAGIYVIATSVSLPGAKEGRLIDTGMVLGQQDPYETAAFLKTSAGSIPSIKESSGRGVMMRENTALEMQTVKTGTDEIGAAERGITARRYPNVPKDPTVEDVLARTDPDIVRERGIPVGYETKSGKLFYLPLKGIRLILIGGKPYSGRHTMLFNISIIAARYGMECVRADTYTSLIGYLRDKSRKRIITTVSISGILENFYENFGSGKEEDELAGWLKNPPYGYMTGESDPLVIGIVENETAMRFAGKKLYEAMTEHPFAIILGGCLNENRIFDFSYLPYSEMQKSQTRGYATILRYDEKTYFGPVTVPVSPPAINSVDNSQTQ